ncbi:MAG: TIGR01777 family protein [Pyrinomonadaceae bacterium]|nr:TIGR01777 family protein [Pyrinomonadaceae bacterium]
MKIVIPGGSGQVGTVLARAFMKDGHDVTILSRGKPGEFNTVQWDGRTHDKWVSEIDEADVVINLAGRNVNCRYTAENRKEIMDSRVESARAVGEAIAIAKSPPAVWLQASTATIYSHRYDAPNDDIDGIIGGTEDDAPDTWKFSIDVARNWEKAANDVITPDTRKVMMRSAMTMSPDKEGIFDTLYGLVKMGLGGTAGNGKQFISWVHETDFINAVYFLIENEELDGPVNIAAPNPLPNSEFMRIFRRKAGMPFGLPASKWMLELGARLMNTETELILKSRRVVSRRLEDTGFEFEYPVWEDALKDLLSRRN